VHILENSQVKAILEEKFKGDEINVTGDGYHYQLTIISDEFNGLTRVKRTQLVYLVLDKWIKSGELHALSIKPFTSQEWEDNNNG
jgi:acid stress-induced BolA-like protein IbaG/YrbA